MKRMYIIKGIFKKGDYFYDGQMPDGTNVMLNPAMGDRFRKRLGYTHIKHSKSKKDAKKRVDRIAHSILDAKQELPAVFIIEQIHVPKKSLCTKLINFKWFRKNA